MSQTPFDKQRYIEKREAELICLGLQIDLAKAQAILEARLKEKYLNDAAVKGLFL